MSENQTSIPNQTVIITQPNPSNGLGTAGFVCALIALVLCWVPVLGWILWLVGLVLSCVGLSKRPKGLAIAGLVISLFVLLLLILVMGAMLAIFSNLV
ncbi:MAG: hypothetical protein FWE10_04495 [Rikenellaceae bacterium]|nr:hypothetical protein [Rikenellaceae bacterium]MCL2692865.1 hypothetical protein [Rikenellaceae bacterium]